MNYTVNTGYLLLLGLALNCLLVVINTEHYSTFSHFGGVRPRGQVNGS